VLFRLKKGMPGHAIPAALAWSATNVRPRKGQGPTKAAALPQPPAPKDGDPDDLNEARELASRIYRQTKDAPPAALAGLVQAFHKSVDAVRVLERVYISRELDAQTLLHADTVRSMLAERDSKIIALLEALPTSVASAANPADPELARAAVADAVEQLRVTVASPDFLD
jgi:hypothetical protein